jgi:hypothetical protein
MQSLVVRYTKDVDCNQAYVINVPIEYKSLEQFVVDFHKWCLETKYAEEGFCGTGLQSEHAFSMQVLSLEEWFWRYKKTIGP